MKRGWVIGCSIAGVLFLVCGGLITTMVVMGFSAIASLTKPADDFLTMLGSGNTAGAYQSGASGLRAAETPEQFAAFVKSSRLDQYRSSSWTQFNIVNNEGTVEGTVTLKDGSTVPLKLSLANEGGWKVMGLKLTGTPPAPVVPPTPTEGEVRKLVNRDLGEFRRAVERNDFTDFRALLSKKMKEQSPAEIGKPFAPLVVGKADLSAVEPGNLTVTKPATLLTNDVIRVEGEYLGGVLPVRFELEYKLEGGEWRVSYIRVVTTPD
jgi:hypothetical protein